MSATAPGRGPRRRPSPPLAVQIIALLLCGIVLAQLVTLGLTLLLPPAPPAQHSLADIAAGLQGRPIANEGARPLLRAADDQPPSLQSPGWFVSEQAHADLARLMKVDPDAVRLLFYAPLPFAGTPTRQLSAVGRERQGGALAAFEQAARSLLVPAAEARPPAGAALPMPGLPGGLPVGGPVPAMLPAPGTGQGFPMNGMAGSGAQPFGNRIAPPIGPGSPGRGPVWASHFPPAGPGSAGFAPPTGSTPAGAGPAGGRRTGPTPAARPPMMMPMPGLFAAGGTAPSSPPVSLAPQAFGPLPDGQRPLPLSAGPRPRAYEGQRPLTGLTVVRTAFTPPAQTESRILQAPPRAEPVLTRETRQVQTPVPLVALVVPAPEPTVTRVPVVGAARAVTAAAPQVEPGRTVAVPEARGLFGIAPAPYIEGDFIAAYRVAPNRWVTLRTQPEGFPNAWQKRVMLWFAISFAIVAPLGWIFARRLARPLTDFAVAAERLGRQPTAESLVLEGPAELGQAARAFNQMQARLRRYVEDRTGMIGAISHDLRTPLARLRFRIERASPTLRREMARDLDQMEAMITSVLTFMRDNAEPGQRQRVDLRSIIECAVDDAGVIGAEVRLEPGGPAEVEVDVLGIQRVFANLIDNAIKYGVRARVRLFPEHNEIVAEITDHGPGLADSDLDRVFLPFYRSAEARNSGRQGVGLGLSVSRSTVRAHGGDIRLRRGQTGLVAEVRLPMAGRAPAPRTVVRPAAVT